MAAPSHAPARSVTETEREALSAILGNLRRNTRVIGLTTLIGVSIITGLVTLGLTPQYVAITTILVDSRKTQILKDQEVIGRPGTENGAIESEAEVAASPGVLRRVAEDQVGGKNDATLKATRCAAMNRVQDDYARNYPEYGSFHKVA